MNRKGGVVAIGFFVVVAFILVVVALVSFSKYGESQSGFSTLSLRLVNGLNYDYDFIFSSARLILKEAVDIANKEGISDFSGEAFKGKIKEIAEKRNLMLDIGGNLFEKIKNNEFEIASQDGIYLFESKGLVIEARDGVSYMKRAFNLAIKFSESGILD